MFVSIYSDTETGTDTDADKDTDTDTNTDTIRNGVSDTDVGKTT